MKQKNVLLQTMFVLCFIRSVFLQSEIHNLTLARLKL